MASKRVYKYPLSFDGPTMLELTGPIVHVGLQYDGYNRHGNVCLWAEAEVHPPRLRTFSVHGTGHDIDGPAQHVGSTIDQIAGAVWHVYEPKS